MDALEATVKRFRTVQFPKLERELSRLHDEAGLGDLGAAFRIDFAGDPTIDITKARGALVAERQAIMGEEPDVQIGDLDAVVAQDLGRQAVVELRREVARLEAAASLDATDAAEFAKLTGRLRRLRQGLTSVERQIELADAADGEIARLESDRLQLMQSCFDTLVAEEEELRAMYAPLHQRLASVDLGDWIHQLQFAVRRHVAVDEWAAQGEDLFDLRRVGSLRRAGSTERVARESGLLTAWQEGDGAGVVSVLARFAESQLPSLRKLRAGESDSDYRQWENALNNWLFSVDHVSLDYSLRFEDADIQYLSPGTRGIVLLALYLALDQDDTDPLIVDQPEENLDPESIYSKLVSLFRAASTRRQIIMVTHNANLVVNADVDQVILARAERRSAGELPFMSYSTGGLENLAIRRSVCAVLEGGEAAFLERARRLGLELPM